MYKLRSRRSNGMKGFMQKLRDLGWSLFSIGIYLIRFLRD